MVGKMERALQNSEVLLSVIRIIQMNLDRGAPYILAIEGKGCSGKSTIAKEIERNLSEQGIITSTIPIDNFCLPRAFRYRDDSPIGEQVYRFNFDYELFDRLIVEARTTGRLSYRHDYLNVKTDTYDGRAIYSVCPGGVLIVEGIFVLRRHLIPHYNLKIYVDISDEDQIARARIRDIDRGNSQSQIEYKYHERYRPSYDMFLTEHRPQEIADLLFRSQ
ncbi:hypothetical protein [Novosphingobium sp.]|uniref:hypothetical protein n=1 Tax=Novosphingobium sp. TaxID=1874826 RepID=UPI003B524570